MAFLHLSKGAESSNLSLRGADKTRASSFLAHMTLALCSNAHFLANVFEKAYELECDQSENVKLDVLSLFPLGNFLK